MELPPGRTVARTAQELRHYRRQPSRKPDDTGPLASLSTLSCVPLMGPQRRLCPR